MTVTSGAALVRPFGRALVHAPTGEEAATFDRRAIDQLGVPQTTLMENAGRAAAQVVDRLYPEGSVLAVVGAGNNGGDGLVLIRTLASWGRSVMVVTVADRVDRALLHGWDIPVVDGSSLAQDAEWDGVLAQGAVLVDSILGTGIRGAPRELQAQAIRALNRAGQPIVAMDLPSGTDAESGAVEGEAVRADVTVAFGWPKLGTLFQPARTYAGRLVAVEISFPPTAADTFRARLATPAWASEQRPRREPDAHKNAVGSLLLVAGRSGMAGAAVMAARAALRAGVGLLRVASPPENREVVQSTVPEAIYVDTTDPRALVDGISSSTAVAAGPGIGTDQAAAEVLTRVLEAESEAPLLLDADALTMAGAGAIPSFSDLPDERPVLVTPHVGEMSRISDATVEEIAAGRAEVARRTSRSLGVTVLLKGLPSVVANPEGSLMVDTVGTSDLATGGMGDVLAGVAGAFLAQAADPLVAGALGLVTSGRAAVRADKGASLLPEDVIEELPHAMMETGEGVTDLDLPFVVFDQDPPR
ncbi:MAG: bifunctional ADP-dependent NAD(P)H-hydrate dehydratase/NAD(P)H-hydrate epimerase [Gemmatimonadota bacterium]|nr:MAG: bifunctional ADP-dependent NAD(P)H-hydrate dehydratase/NAD(P)H-hydrate epimerase [Gemmatimonadota bacterium]